VAEQSAVTHLLAPVRGFAAEINWRVAFAPKEDKKLRYAVPIVDNKVATHFGHCSHFVLFDVDETRNVIIRKEIVASPGHEPGLLPAWLAEEGVCVVIASGMGSRAQSLFRENRIEIVINALEDDPEKAVLDHIRGTLATGDNICDH